MTDYKAQCDLSTGEPTVQQQMLRNVACRSDIASTMLLDLMCHDCVDGYDCWRITIAGHAHIELKMCMAIHALSGMQCLGFGPEDV